MNEFENDLTTSKEILELISIEQEDFINDYFNCSDRQEWVDWE